MHYALILDIFDPIRALIVQFGTVGRSGGS